MEPTIETIIQPPPSAAVTPPISAAPAAPCVTPVTPCPPILWGGVEVTAAQFMEFQRLASARSGWLQRNISAILAIILVLGAFSIFVLILRGGLTIGVDNKDIVVYIVSAFTTTLSAIIGFYFGSSNNSAKKDETIRSLSNSGK